MLCNMMKRSFSIVFVVPLSRLTLARFPAMSIRAAITGPRALRSPCFETPPLPSPASAGIRTAWTFLLAESAALGAVTAALAESAAPAAVTAALAESAALAAVTAALACWDCGWP